MTPFDWARQPHTAQSGVVKLPFLELLPELKCPICLEVLTETMTTKECLHRFCSDCITKSLQLKKECPTCRMKVPSRRSLRRDDEFDKLVSALYPDTNLVKAREQDILAKINMASNQAAYREVIEEGMKTQDKSKKKYRGNIRSTSSEPLAKRVKRETTKGESHVDPPLFVEIILDPVHTEPALKLDRPFILTMGSATVGHLREHLVRSIASKTGTGSGDKYQLWLLRDSGSYEKQKLSTTMCTILSQKKNSEPLRLYFSTGTMK